MVERCPDKTEVDGPIPSTLTRHFGLLLFMNENDKNEAWWKPGVMMFTKMSGLIAVPVIIGLYLGRYLDKRFDTAPWAFVVSMGFAFTISMIGIGRLAIKYIHEAEINIKKKDTGYDTRNK